MNRILQGYSFLYHAVLALFFLGISLVAFLSGQPLQMKALPWTGASLTHWVLALSLAGLLIVLISFFVHAARSLFALWALIVLLLMIRGLFFSSFAFSNFEQFKWGVALTAGAFGAFMGALVSRRKL